MLCPKFILLRRRSDYTYEAQRVRWGVSLTCGKMDEIPSWGT